MAWKIRAQSVRCARHKLGFAGVVVVESNAERIRDPQHDVVRRRATRVSNAHLCLNAEGRCGVLVDLELLDSEIRLTPVPKSPDPEDQADNPNDETELKDAAQIHATRSILA
jgi:hypothetical protein